MPLSLRRPSGAAISPPIASASRVHRSQDSSYGLGQSRYSLGNTAAQQQKIVQVLVNRLKNNLPCHSGTTLDRLEADKTTQQAVNALVKLSHDSLDTIALALCELIERLAKPEEGELTIELLQSQLFVLKVLATAMSARWHNVPRSSSQASNGPGSAPESPVPTSKSSSKWSRASSDNNTNAPSWAEPPPMEDNCARYLLSVMVLFLRQSAQKDPPLIMCSLESSDIDFRDHETMSSQTVSALLDSVDSPELPELPQDLKSRSSSNSMNSAKFGIASISSVLGSTSYEPTPSSMMNSHRYLNELIEKYTGRIIFHISASNWGIVFHRIRLKIRQLAQNEVDLDAVDIQLMSHCALDRARLVQALNELASLLVNMSSEAHLACANPIRLAIWNWIRNFPHEYNDIMQSKAKMEGAPERVFDHFHSRLKPGTEPQMWPTLSALICVSPDRISPDPFSGHQKSKSQRFMDDILRHVNPSSRLFDVGVVCGLDLCRAAMYVAHDDDPLRSTASDIVHEIKSNLFLASNVRPFWDSSHESINIALLAEVLVALYRFLPAQESLDIFSAASELDRSDAVLTCICRALKTLQAESTIFPLQPEPTLLAPVMQRRMWEISKLVWLCRTDVRHNSATKRNASRPKAKKASEYGLSDREVLIMAILTVWRSAPMFAGPHTLPPDETEHWPASIARLWNDPYDNVILAATNANSRWWTEAIIRNPPSQSITPLAVDLLLGLLIATITCLSTNLLHCRTDIKAQRLLIQADVEHLALSTLKTNNEDARRGLIHPRRVPAFLIAEIAFLVSLTSQDNDISQLAAQGLRLISLAERQVGAPENPLMNTDELSKRIPVYEQLGDPKVIIHGRNMRQKRVRRLLRLTPFSPSVCIAVWEECYWRWRSLTELVINVSVDDTTTRSSDSTTPQQIARSQWQNLTLFLASMGGICARDTKNITVLSDLIPAKHIPDQLRGRPNPLPLVQSFVRDLTRHLVHDDLQIRETARDALGTELDPKLYGRLIRHLEDTIEATRSDTSSERARLIGEQSITVLKLMVDRNQERIEEVINIDITTTLQALAAFLEGSDGGAELARLKIKFCTLCDSAAERPDTLTLKKDSHARRILLNIVSSWMKMDEEDALTPQAELNMACLRTTVKLLDRLDLKEQEPTTVVDDGSHYVTREFSKYFKVLQTGLLIGSSPDVPVSDSMSDIGSIQKRMRASVKEAELRELVITGLSHLVSSDPEVGLKQCLDLAYGDDHRGRAIFAHVFARVIGQGARFEALDQTQTTDRYKRLSDLVKEPNLILVQAICDTCPTSETESMVAVLLNLFNTRASLMSLLKFMIYREVNHTENESSLFRSNSIYNRFLSAFAKIQGYNYLRQLIMPIVKAMADLPAGQGYELDPTKAHSQDLDQNQQNVQFLTSKFLDLIYASRAGLPPMFREVCSHITDAVSARWPAHQTLRLTAVGAFLFLRFISPAVVAPETIDIDLPNDSLRRGLMIIAKIIQNLANNVLFGKEPHMKRLNEYLGRNIKIVTQFFSIILTEHLDEDDRDEWLGGMALDDTDGIVLHRFFDKHADKIGKELLSISKPSVESDTSGVTGKRTWDTLCTLLVDLGAPLEAPRFSTLESHQHDDLLDLKARYDAKPKTSVAHLFIPVRRKETSVALFCYRVAQVDIETVDFELVLSHVFETLLDTQLPFDVIVDCTGFHAKGIIPLRWIKYCLELIPSDVRSRLMSVYVLNNNMESLKYQKRIANFCGTLTVFPDVHRVSSVAALMEQIPDIQMEDLGYPADLEREPCEEISTATIKVSSVNPNQPATIRLASSHIRITCLSASGATEIITMADISDAYVTGPRDKNEFIIRRNRQGTTLYLTSPSNDHIVKSIRTAKSRISENHTSLSDRFSRFSNIPATLLHVGMLNADVSDEEVRTAAYNLLGAVCTYLGYDKSPVVASKAGFIPGDPSTFVVQLSERVAEFAPQLTLDFISEVTAAMNIDQKAHGHIGQSIGCLYYLSPWVKNFAHFANPISPLFDRTATRLRDCIRGLSDLSMSYPELRSAVQKHIWSQVATLDPHVVDIVLDELIRGAIDSGAGTSRCETHAHIISSFSSIGVRGKLFSKLRKAIIKASPRSTRSLVDGNTWNEVSTLARVCLIAGYQVKNPQHNQLYTPEVVHCIMMVAGVGSTIVRKSVYGILIQLLQSLLLSRSDEAVPSAELNAVVAEVSEESTLELFGLHRATTNSEYTKFDPTSDSVVLDHHERLAVLLVRTLEVSAGNKGLLNVWRARWMSLVTSSAFQYSSMIQMRSFTVLGVLATASLDEDFLYQALVAFSSSLSMMEPADTLASVGILRAISKLVPGLPEDTQFLPQLFWMGVAFLQSGYINFYAEAARLVQISLEIMDQREVFGNTPVATYLLNARAHLEEYACGLDQNLGLSFDSNFSFALAAIVFKGIRRAGKVRDAADALLRTALRVTSRWRDDPPITNGHPKSLKPDILGYFLALIPLSTSSAEYNSLLADCQIDSAWRPHASSFDDGSVAVPSAALLGVQDDQVMALFATSFLSAILISAQGDDTETQILYGTLSDIATVFPEIVSMAYESLQERIKDTFANSSNPSVIRYVSDIIRVALQDTTRWSSRGSASTLSTVEEGYHHLGRNHLNALEEYAMPGLGNHFKFLPPSEGFDSIVPHLVRIVDAIAQPIAD